MPHRIETTPGGAEDARRTMALPAWTGGTPDLRALARLLGMQFLLGALVLLVAVAMPATDESDEPYLLAVAGAGVLLGTWLRVLRRPGRRAVDGALLTLVLMITTVVASARPMGLTPLFYFWPLLMAAIYSTPRMALTLTALAVTAFGAIIVSGVTPVGDPPVLFLQFAGSTVAIMVAVRRLRDVVEQLVAQLDRTASRDALTGALNRGAFERVLARHDERAPAADRRWLLLLDIDHFKQINDTHGHPAGDAALRRLVRLVVGELREGDALGRVGGEEFAILLATPGEDAARAAAERIRATVAERSAQPSAPAFTVSIGVAGPGAAPDLWHAADRALYAAKLAGRDRVVAAGELAARAAALSDAA